MDLLDLIKGRMIIVGQIQLLYHEADGAVLLLDKGMTTVSILLDGPAQMVFLAQRSLQTYLQHLDDVSLVTIIQLEKDDIVLVAADAEIVEGGEFEPFLRVIFPTEWMKVKYVLLGHECDGDDEDGTSIRNSSASSGAPNFIFICFGSVLLPSAWFTLSTAIRPLQIKWKKCHLLLQETY